MISFKARSEMLGRTETELKSEMAASLGRIGRTLESLIAQLQHIRNELPEIGDERKEHYRTLHGQAELYYWYLIVQREAIGIRNHTALRQTFRIPDKI
jgi:hypothetical protein